MHLTKILKYLIRNLRHLLKQADFHFSSLISHTILQFKNILHTLHFLTYFSVDSIVKCTSTHC